MERVTRGAVIPSEHCLLISPLLEIDLGIDEQWELHNVIFELIDINLPDIANHKYMFGCRWTVNVNVTCHSIMIRWKMSMSGDLRHEVDIIACDDQIECVTAYVSRSTHVASNQMSLKNHAWSQQQ